MNENEDIAPHIDDIARVLKDEVNRDEIERELRHYLTEYRIPLGTAKQMLVKKYGGTPSELGLGVSRTVEQLGGNEPSVDLLARVVSVNFKDVEVNDEKKRIAFGLLGDQTATIPFTVWNTEDWKFQKGDVVSVHNAYTKEWRGKPQLNFGDRTQVELKSKDALPTFVPRSPAEPSNCRVRDLKGGVSNVTLTARVLFIEERTVKVGDEQKQVFSGILADETGKVQFSSWHDFGLTEGDIIKIAGGYVKTWRGIPQFNFDERAQVVKLDTSDMPSLEELSKRRVYQISELTDRGGAVDAAVEGVIIDIRTGSGLILRCPECNRVVQKGVCRIHGEVAGKPDLRIKAVLDDGTGALTAIMGRGITESLLGRDIEECQEIARDAMDGTVIADELRELLVATPIRVSGDATMDEFGIMLISKDAEFIKTDVVTEARAMLEELEG